MKFLYGSFFLLASLSAAAEPINPIESSGDVSHYTASPLFVVGIYEPNNEHGWRLGEDGSYTHIRERGEGTIYIEEQSSDSVTLALGSYEPTDWEIKGPGADNVSQVILFGYHSSTVSGQTPGILVYDKTYETGSSGYIRSFYNWNSRNRAQSIYELEAISGETVTSFSGVYNAESFHIDSH